MEIVDAARSYVKSIKRVCETIDLPEDNYVLDPWPSHVYFEDVNGQSQFELVELILDEVGKGGVFERGSRSEGPIAAPWRSTTP